MATYPPIVNLSRLYLPYFATSACIALSLWLALLMARDRSIKITWLFGASLAFGLLIHPRFVRVAPAPAVAIGIYTLFFQTRPRRPAGIRQTWVWLAGKLRDPFVVRGLLPAGLIALVPTLLWYLTHGLDLYRTLQRLKVAELAAGGTITVGFDEVRPFSLWYVLTAPAAISNILSYCAVAGLIFAIVKPRLPASMLAITFIAAYVFLGLLDVVYAWWHFAAALPVAATLTALWATSLRHKWLSRTLVLLCLAVATFNFSIVTWGVRPWSERIAIALGSPLAGKACSSRGGALFCPAPAQTERWPLLEIQQAILSDPACQEGRPCQLMTITAGVGFSAETFRHHLLQNQALDKVFVVSQGFSRILQPYNLTGLLQSDFLLYPEYPPGRPKSRPNSSYIRISNDFLNAPPAAFDAAHQTVARLRLPNGRTAKLIKRTRPLTVEEAEATFAALDLPEINNSQKNEILADLYAMKGHRREALRLYQDAAENSADAHALVRALRGSSRIYRDTGEPDLALALYLRILEINPNDVSARVQLAGAYAETGDSESAISELETAMALAPDSPWPRRELAKHAISRGDFERAIELCREALEIKPKTSALACGWPRPTARPATSIRRSASSRRR